MKQVCDQCGLAGNVLTCLVKFGAMPKQLKTTISTYHTGVCEVCHRTASVTEERDYYYPNFDLLSTKWGREMRHRNKIRGARHSAIILDEANL